MCSNARAFAYPFILLFSALLVLSSAEPSRGAFQATNPSLEKPEVEATSSDVRALYRELNSLRVDASRVYYVHGLDLRRDVVRLSFQEGKLAFYQSLGGRLTGAVFLGIGHVVASPRDASERRSLARYLGVPLLDVPFSRAYLRFTDDTPSELWRQLEAASAQPASDLAFGESWEPVAARLNPWHSLRILTDWLSSEPHPYFYAGLESESRGSFEVLVDHRRDEQVLIGQSHLINGVPAYDVWASFRAKDAQKRYFEPFAPLDYRVETTIAEDLSLTGKATLHIKTTIPGERIVPLELSRNLVAEEVRSGSGGTLVFFQNEELNRREIARRGNDSLLVVLSAAPRAAEELKLEISYRGNVISNAGNGVEFVGERGTWYPHLRTGQHFVSFDLTFRWPRRFTLVATGTRTEFREEGSQRIGRWQSEVPFAVAGFNLGEYQVESVGVENLRIHLYASRELEDAILARLRQSPISSLPALPFPPRPLPEVHPELSLEPPVPSPAAVLKQLGSEVLDSIRFFEKFNGPFPFDHLDVSQIPGSFGQSWPELLYLSTLAFLPPEAQQRVGMGAQSQEEARELLPFHEVAHQWWGNEVAPASYRDAWIEEAMANYLALLYADSRKPAEHRLAHWLEYFRTLLLDRVPGTSETVEATGPLEQGYRLASSSAPEAYETIAYGKGTWVIHMLREMLRDPASKDPDARFRGLLASILAENRFRAIGVPDLQRAVEARMNPSMDLEGTGRMDWFFDQWVRGTGIPRFSVEFQAKPHGQELLISGKLKQNDVPEVFTAAVPLYGTGSGGKRMRLGIVVTTGPETHFHFLSRTRPTRILIDPQSTLLRRTE